MGQVIVLGLISGVIYGLFALGIVLVYRGTNSINFAQGEIGTLALYAAWFVTTENELPWILGALAAVVVAAAVGAGFERLVVAQMVKSDRVVVAVATIGLLSFLLATEARLFGASPRTIEGPIAGIGYEMFGVFVSPTQILALFVCAGVAFGLALFLRNTDFGLGILAVAEDPDAARLNGVPLKRVSTFVWGTGAAVSALGALLIEPTIGVFQFGFASQLFLTGLAAAVVGGLSSFGGAFAGGIALGILEAAAKKIFGGAAIPGISSLTVFGVVILMLLVRPGGLVTMVRRRTA